MRPSSSIPSSFARFHRHAVIVACAAVLLTSFEDEALLAISSARAIAAEEVGPQPDQTEELSRFPDLSQSRSDRGDGETSDEPAATAIAGNAVTAHSLPRHALTTSNASAILAGASLRTWLCVWLI